MTEDKKQNNDLKKRVFELVEMSTSQAAHTQSFVFVLKENNFLTEYNRDRKKLVVEKMKRLLRPKKNNKTKFKCAINCDLSAYFNYFKAHKF